MQLAARDASCKLAARKTITSLIFFFLDNRRITFEGGVVGKALKGPICTYEFSGGVSMDHSSVVGLVAATVAHEMGHNFGMEHDGPDCGCPEEKYVVVLFFFNNIVNH